MYMYLAGKGQYESPVFLPLFLSEGKVQTKALGIPRLPLLPAGVKPAQTHTDTHAHKLFSLWHYLTSVQQGVGLQLTTFLHVCRGLGWMALLIISKQQLSHQKTHCFSQIDVSHAGLWSQTPCPSTQKCVFFFFFSCLFRVQNNLCEFDTRSLHSIFICLNTCTYEHVLEHRNHFGATRDSGCNLNNFVWKFKEENVLGVFPIKLRRCRSHNRSLRT